MAQCQYQYWDGQRCRYERHLEKVIFESGGSFREIYSPYCYYHHKKMGRDLFDLEPRDHKMRQRRGEIEL